VCMPERWHADNGGEFKNHYMDAVREMLAVNADSPQMLLAYSHGMPRNPQCQGLVERGNRTIKHAMHKLMEYDGWFHKTQTYEWRPYLKRVVRDLNRKIVKMYGFCPIVMMTGAPPEAPDHVALTPFELSRLHEECAKSQQRYADGMEASVKITTFKQGDVVLVHKRMKRSHNDKQGKGGRTFPATAVVVRESKTQKNYYKIRWLGEGLTGNEKYGQMSAKNWFSWRLKLNATHKNGTNETYDRDLEIIAEVMEGAGADKEEADEPKQTPEDDETSMDFDTALAAREARYNTQPFHNISWYHTLCENILFIIFCGITRCVS
jgi:hypothetical protein